MALPEWYVKKLQEEIAHLQGILRPLQSGKIHVGDVSGDRTRAPIDALKHSIADLQYMVDRRDACTAVI